MSQRTQIPTMTEGDWIILDTVEFPQANDLFKVFRVAEAAVTGATNPEEVARELEIVLREGAYYGSAAAALRLIRKRDTAIGVEYRPTELGVAYVNADAERRNTLVIQRTLDCPHVKFVAHRLGLDLPLRLPVPDVVLDQARILAAISELPELNRITQRRRASTIVSWMKTVNRLRA